MSGKPCAHISLKRNMDACLPTRHAHSPTLAFLASARFTSCLFPLFLFPFHPIAITFSSFLLSFSLCCFPRRLSCFSFRNIRILFSRSHIPRSLVVLSALSHLCFSSSFTLPSASRCFLRLPSAPHRRAFRFPSLLIHLFPLLIHDGPFLRLVPLSCWFS